MSGNMIKRWLHRDKCPASRKLGDVCAVHWELLMRCLFCKEDSTSSRSVEHIMPEALGNQEIVLPRGIVCDACNNYFATKVEKRFLELPLIAALRFRQDVPGKKKTLPELPVLLLPHFPASLSREHGSNEIALSLDDAAVHHVLSSAHGRFLYWDPPPLPEGPIVSRFLAKVGLEYLASRLLHADDVPRLVEELVEHEDLDALRQHARYGRTERWPYNARQIYDEDARWCDIKDEDYQIAHELELVSAASNEWYFVLAIFGREFAINLGGPAIDGYLRWLTSNNGVSPLHGKEHSDEMLPSSYLPRKRDPAA